MIISKCFICKLHQPGMWNQNWYYLMIPACLYVVKLLRDKCKCSCPFESCTHRLYYDKFEIQILISEFVFWFQWQVMFTNMYDQAYLRDWSKIERYSFSIYPKEQSIAWHEVTVLNLLPSTVYFVFKICFSNNHHTCKVLQTHSNVLKI